MRKFHLCGKSSKLPVLRTKIYRRECPCTRLSKRNLLRRASSFARMMTTSCDRAVVFSFGHLQLHHLNGRSWRQPHHSIILTMKMTSSLLLKLPDVVDRRQFNQCILFKQALHRLAHSMMSPSANLCRSRKEQSAVLWGEILRLNFVTHRGIQGAKAGLGNGPSADWNMIRCFRVQ